MDALGSELVKQGHSVNVSAPMMAQQDFTNYDVVIGNSQGAVVAMTRKQKIKPRLVITIDLPYAGLWRSNIGVRHLNIYGTWFKTGRLNGARNVHIAQNHLALSYSHAMRKVVKNSVNVW